MEDNCRFFKKGICAYKHVSSTNDNESLDELNNLKSEIAEIINILKLKQEQIDKITSEKKI